MAKYIFFDDRLQKRAGGPSTYLYNLRNALNDLKSNEIQFICNENENVNNDVNDKSLRNTIKKFIMKFPFFYERLVMKKRLINSDLYNNLNAVKENDVIMFHMTSDFSKALKLIPSSATKVLMSHSPEIASKQIADDLRARIKNYSFDYTQKSYFDNFDLPAFKNADVLVFPSKEAMEPYYETCENFGEIIKDKKIKYIPTGTEKLEFNISREEFRKKYNIPQNAFILTFIGRHNEVKGYDRFVEICKTMIDKYEDCYVVTAGIGNIESYKHERWIDIGWTNDPGSIANAADIFILPNRRTYFDLVLIEMISIGKTCVVSHTGGNKSMAEYSEGIITFESNEQAIEKIEKIYANRELLNKYSEINKTIYSEYFTPEKFAQRYIELMKEIENEKE